MVSPCILKVGALSTKYFRSHLAVHRGSSMLLNITLLIVFIAALFLFVKFEVVFLPVAIVLALVSVVIVVQHNANVIITDAIILNELEQEENRPKSIFDKSRDALEREGYSEEQIDTILSVRELERPSTQQE